MKKDDKNIISSYLEYLDTNNLYRWGMCQKLPPNSFQQVKKLSKCDERSMKDYDENSNKGSILEVDIVYVKNLFNLHKDLPFLPERNKIKKFNKLVCNIHDK